MGVGHTGDDRRVSQSLVGPMPLPFQKLLLLPLTIPWVRHSSLKLERWCVEDEFTELRHPVSNRQPPTPQGLTETEMGGKLVKPDSSPSLSSPVTLHAHTSLHSCSQTHSPPKTETWSYASDQMMSSASTDWSSLSRLLSSETCSRPPNLISQMLAKKISPPPSPSPILPKA